MGVGKGTNGKPIARTAKGGGVSDSNPKVERMEPHPLEQILKTNDLGGDGKGVFRNPSRWAADSGRGHWQPKLLRTSCFRG